MSDNTQNSSIDNFSAELSPLKSVLWKVLPERFRALVVVRDNGCWDWTGSVRKTTYKVHTHYLYGTYNKRLVHRMAYEAFRGHLVDGLEVDHLCHNKLCVNPSHLELVTHQVNCARRPKSGPYPKRRSK